MSEQSDYEKYRGKCKEFSEVLIKKDPSLRLVREHYYCPIWGEQEHWWCEDKTGKIIDPTKDQFPSKGSGEYIEFGGICICAECSIAVKEEDAIFMSRYPVCSDRCARSLVGL